ncbi:MAG: glycerate dehydrogenase [Chthoniobacter sp.]|nr:glycerate dehydrogenase [Chthoniobacter sp.]
MPDHIVVLDAFTANPGDLSWDALAALAPLAAYDRTAPGEIITRAAVASCVLTNKTALSAETIAALPALRYIGVLATGYNIVDVAAARARGVVVANVPAYSTSSVAQVVFALLLELTHRTGHHANAVREGRWSACPDFSFWDGSLIELAGRTLGIVGYGQIGRAVARIALAFGMKVIAAKRDGRAGHDGEVELVEMETLFRSADVISLHCPLTAQTQGLINAERLGWMKPTAFLINTGRGQLIVERDLAAALDAGRIAGAGLDVLSVEPPPSDHPLLAAKNCLITPHFAWATRESRARLIDVATKNVRAFLAGTPQNVVN